MKIGLVSDTHISAGSFHPKKLISRWINKVDGSAEELCKILRPHFQDVDMVIHAGDFVSYPVITALSEFGPVEGVAGNMDPPEVRSVLPPKKVIKADGFRIGIIHGYGAPKGLEKKLRREFDNVDVIVFGHSHYPVSVEVDGVLMVNPGSPTDKRFAPSRSIGLMHVEGEVRAEIIPLPD